MKYLTILMLVLVGCAKSGDSHPGDPNAWLTEVQAMNTGTYNAGTDTVSGGSYSKVVAQSCGRWTTFSGHPEFAVMNCRGNPNNPYSNSATCPIYYMFSNTTYYSPCF